jgi:hypothetical protein
MTVDFVVYDRRPIEMDLLHRSALCCYDNGSRSPRDAVQTGLARRMSVDQWTFSGFARRFHSIRRYESR